MNNEMSCMRTSGGTMVACDDYGGDEGGIWGAYSVEVMNGSTSRPDQHLVVAGDFARSLVAKP
jgi:hypothetical protein